jgi:phosphatidylserine/phosphatidylglycerophosphate/cardiolipin synthase-like enzyme
VEWAIERQRTFRVIVLVPEQLEGQLEEEPAAFHTRRSLLQGEGSLRGRIAALLEKTGSERSPEDYLFVGSLARVGRAPGSGEWRSHAVLVHSGALLVDDRTALIGSAGVSDRALGGNGDSVAEGESVITGPSPLSVLRYMRS